MLTADHGVSPIPENLAEENYHPARRIVMHKVVDDINQKVQKKFNIEKLLFGFKIPKLQNEIYPGSVEASSSFFA